MFEREHHKRVLGILGKMNRRFLEDAKCYFAGGTAIALLHGEYRESVDIDFLCADQEGYRTLRNSVFDKGLGEIFSETVTLLRDVRADRDGIRTVISGDGTPVKFEIVREARIGLTGTSFPSLPVPCLTISDLFAEKLLANADRYADKSALSRDIIDLMIMEEKWGEIPKEAWNKAVDAYGHSVERALEKAKNLLRSNPHYFRDCIKKMGIAEKVGQRLQISLSTA